MLERSRTFCVLDKLAVLRSIPLLTFLVLAACTAVQQPPIENQFSLVDASKYKDEQQKWLGRQLSLNDCKSKALTASAAIEKSLSSENHGLEN